MQFHLGKPVLAMIVLAFGAGGMVLLRPAPPRADLRVWTFADSHARAYRAALPTVERALGRSVAVDLIPPAALNTRMVTLFMSGRPDALPDAVEVNVDGIAQYLRPPVREVGLLPLNRYLETTGFREIDGPSATGRPGQFARARSDAKVYAFRDGRWVHDPTRSRPDAWIDRLVRARLAPWTKDGRVFGVPHDVHPVTLTYRADLWAEAGLDPSTARTWAGFHDLAIAFQDYWRDRGVPTRHAMELFESGPDHLACLLLQRGVNVIDADGRLRLTDPVVAETVAFYAQLVAGPRKVATESAGGTGPYVNDLAAGHTCATLTPDWRVALLREYAPALAGKLRMIPLPRFDPADAPTSTWSGTMIGIPRGARDPDAAWRLIEALYLDEPKTGGQSTDANGILPALTDAWDRPAYHRPDPLYAGQRTMELYIDLAGRIPPKVVTWATPLATQALGYALQQARGYLNDGRPVDGLTPYVRSQLAFAESYVRRAIEHGKLDD